MELADFDPERLRQIVEGFGVPFSFDAVVICAQDHGVAPAGISHLDFRHNMFKDRLKEIRVPTLVIGAQYDTMDPAHMEWMSGEVQNGKYLYCPNGSHLSQYDDQKTYFEGVIRFVRDVDEKTF